MAFIKCPVCGKQYTDQKETCPFCKGGQTQLPRILVILLTVVLVVAAISAFAYIQSEINLREQQEIAKAEKLKQQKIEKEKRLREERLAKKAADRAAAIAASDLERKRQQQEDPSYLEVNQSYSFHKDLPLMPSHSPNDPLAAMKKIVVLPKNTRFFVQAVYEKNGTPWYRISALGGRATGWINSVALINSRMEKPKKEDRQESYNAATATTKANGTACLTEQWLDDMVQFVAAKDKISFVQYVNTKKCVVLKPDLTVTILKYPGMLGGKTQFAFKGVKMWTTRSALSFETNQ